MALSKDILDYSGNHILLSKGTVLDKSYIEKLNQQGLDFIGIMEESDNEAESIPSIKIIDKEPSVPVFPETDYGKLEDKILEMYKKGDILGAITFANTVLEKLFGKSETPFMVANMTPFRYIPQTEYMTTMDMKENNPQLNHELMVDFLAAMPEELKKLEFLTARFNPKSTTPNNPNYDTDESFSSVVENTLALLKGKTKSGMKLGSDDIIDNIRKQINLLREFSLRNDLADEGTQSHIEDTLGDIFGEINKLRDFIFCGIFMEEETVAIDQFTNAVFAELDRFTRCNLNSLKTLSVLYTNNAIENTSKVFAQLQLLLSSCDNSNSPAQNTIQGMINEIIHDISRVEKNFTDQDSEYRSQVVNVINNIQEKINPLFSILSLTGNPDFPGAKCRPDDGMVTHTQKSAPVHNPRINELRTEQLEDKVAYKERFKLSDFMKNSDIEKFIVSWKKIQSEQITKIFWENLSGKQSNSRQNHELISRMIYKIFQELHPEIHERVFYNKITHNFIMNIVKVLITNPQVRNLINDIKDYSEDVFYHSISVCILSLMTGITVGYSVAMLKELGLGALLHDYGKIFMSKDIFNKPAALNEMEYKHIQQHTNFGYEELRKINGISSLVARVALQHHERVNSSGYPEGLKMEDIEPFARIVSVADVYDAMTTDKPYRNRLHSYEAIEYLRDLSGELFDNELTRNFLFSLDPYPIGSLVQLNSGEKGVIVQISKYLPARPIIGMMVNKEEQLLETLNYYDLKKCLSLFITKVFI